MKELTIEEKAKRYDLAIEKAEKIHNEHKAQPFDVMLKVFPELTESNDEKIKKALIDFFNSGAENGEQTNGVCDKDILAWLEKQGKILRQRADVIIANMLEDKIDGIQRELIEFATNAIEAPWLEIIKSADYYAQRIRNIIDEQDEQKPTDKVEPKFHEGAWVVYECGNEVVTLQIQNIVDGTYEFTDDSTLNVVDENTLRLWTIRDAKDGDIICSNQLIMLFKQWEANTDYNFVIAHAGVDISGKLQITNKHWLISNESKPATKEQRNLLFKEMYKAGYTWNEEKKELKKIEQKTTWSEEDEGLCIEAINLLTNQSLYEICVHLRTEVVDWLKSLKDRYTWKPSDEQMKALSDINITGCISYAGQGQELINLYQDLKKLREG